MRPSSHYYLNRRLPPHFDFLYGVDIVGHQVQRADNLHRRISLITDALTELNAIFQDHIPRFRKRDEAS